MTPSVEPFRLSPSLIAHFFNLECDRFLRFRATPTSRAQEEGVPEASFDHSPLMRDVMASGLAWEAQVLGEHLADQVEVAPGDGPLAERRFDCDTTVRLLQTLVPGRHLYQATLRPTQGFYRALGLDPALARFADCHPDLIEVIDTPDGRLFRVIDIKRGESLQLAYRVQVLLYALILDGVLREQGIMDARVDLEQGGVWLGGTSKPETFEMAPLLPYLRQFLGEQLPQLLARPADEAFWHFSYNCERCGFMDRCREEMRRTNDISLLTNVTVHGKRHLADLGVRTLSDLESFLTRPEADDLMERCASLAGDRHYMERRLAAFSAAAPRSQESATALPVGENVTVILTLQREPLGRSTYMAGILTHTKPENLAALTRSTRDQLFDSDGKGVPLVFLAETPDEVTAIRDAFIRALHGLLADIDLYNSGRDWSAQLSLQVYTHTDRDRAQLTEWLLECVRDPAMAEVAMALLLHFQCPDLLNTDEHPDQPVPYPVIVLQNALTKMVALPIEVSYTLPETLQALGTQWEYARKDYYHYPLGHGLRSEAIHAAWHMGKPERLKDLRREAGAYLRAQRSLLWALRSTVGDQLYAWPPKFRLPGATGIQDPILSRLAFLTRYESVLDYLGVREGRAEPQEVRLRLGLTMALRALGDDEFEVRDGEAMELEEGGFPKWLLSRAGAEGRRAQLAFKDFNARDKLFIARPSPHVAMAGVPSIMADGGVARRIRLRFATNFEGGGPKPGEDFHIQPRFTDFNSDRVLNYLRDLDRTGGSFFLNLLRNTSVAAGFCPLPAPVEARAAAAEAPLGLTASQLSAYRSMRNQRALAVWGPPGTGKTHFLAAAILALASAHASEGRPFRVLITAFTHAAIENLLRKVAELAPVLSPVGTRPMIGKAKEWKGTTPTGAATIAENRLPQWLDDHPVSVVGGTVYSCLKAQKNVPLPGFDLVVVDEASQVRVGEAAVAISAVASQGRLILAGDDLQLPPIVQGVYPEGPEGEPVLHRSIFEAVRSGVPEGSPVVAKLLENRRMNDVLTSFAAQLLYGSDYRCFDESIAGRRLQLCPTAALSGLAAACLDPDYPLVVVVLEGVQATKRSLIEARLVADLAMALRESLLDASGHPYNDDGEFFRHGLFMVSPHRAQNRAIQQELRTRRDWQSVPFADTVDKMQGQEADAVLVSYGVADPEYALLEAEFIYSVNRLNVAITRARSKSVVFLPRPLLDSLPGVINLPEAERGLAFMRSLVDAAGQQAAPLRFALGEGITAVVMRASHPLT